MDFFFQNNSVENSLICPRTKSASHCLTEFPIYQNKHWTIKRWDDHIVVQSSHRNILTDFYSLHWKSKKSRSLFWHKKVCGIFVFLIFYFNQVFSANAFFQEKLWKWGNFKIISTCCLACPTRSVLRRSRNLIGSANLISINSLEKTIHLYAVN